MSLFRLISGLEQFHSAYQIDRLILARSGITVWGCYKQAVRETLVRTEALVCLLDDVSQKKTRTHNEKVTPLGLVNAEHRIGNRFSEVMILAAIRDTAIELERFLRHVIRLRQTLGPLTPARRDELEEDLWCHRAMVSLARDLLEIGRPCRETVELIFSLPRSKKTALLAACIHPQAKHGLINWYINYIPPTIGLRELGSTIRELPTGERIAALYQEWWSAEFEPVPRSICSTSRHLESPDASV